ncbi:hypothetical protein DVH24_036951 [Malus domestica]|uniref:Inositol polyphosphate-related phosphatase domain-containing protein n=1 Tax=Malus domestica TaxID=3750 RepID=A0A498IHG3_MALDO|nr:hypothetical protein DVH24_036951 [Malus domestica]
MDENEDLFSSPSFSGNPPPSDLRKFSLLDQTRADTLTPSASKLFPDSSSSSSEDEDNVVSLHSTSKRLDYMLQFLDRKLSVINDDDYNKNNNSSSNYNNNNNKNNASEGNCSSSLPEFLASGGGTGIFKVPIRAAVHPNRPPRLEVRPHPLRETQIGCFLRTMVSTASQLWVGTECAVRVWNLSDLYSAAGQGESGDEEAVPYRESVCTSAVICLVGDEGNKMVWSGHRDGRIRCWKMDSAPTPTNPFKEGLSWQAHRGPVLSIVISCYGKFICLFIYSTSAAANAATTTTLIHLGDLWSGSEGGSIKIWPREALEKALSLTAEERHMSSLLVERSYIEPWTQVAVNGFTNILTSDVRYLLSDRSGAKLWTAGYLSFALDARTRELLKLFSTDGQIENRVDISSAQDFSAEPIAGSKKDKIQSSFGFFQRSRNAIMGAADAVRRVAVKGAFGDDNRRTEALVIAMDGMIWTGCTNGLLVQWDRNGNRIQEYHYHSSAVQCFCTFGLRIWVGYASGTVHVLDLEGNLLGGWVAHSSPVIKMAAGAGFIFTLANQGGICGWNITSPGPLDNILCSELAGKEFTYTRIENLKILTGTWNVGQGRASQDSLISWLGSVAATVGIVVVGLQEVEMGAGFLAMSAAKETVGLEGSSVGQWWLDMIGKTLDEGLTFERVGSRQLAGLLIAVSGLPLIHSIAASASSAVQMLRGTHAIGNNSAEGMPELSEADMIIFLGDFNYRLDGISYDEARDFVSQRCFDWLRERDQLRVEMEAGNVFQGMREADIKFPPTYKFERHQAGLAGYDSGEKKRTPAWCDRILYRDSRSASVSECSLECPVVSSISQYEACMDVTDSDHKPVRCIFTVDIARVDESLRRQEFGEILKSNEKIKCIIEEQCKIPETIVSTNNIILQNQDTSILRITNKCGDKDAFFDIICEGQSIIKEDGPTSDYCSFGFPRWLEVTPSAGIIRPDHIAEVTVHHEEHQTLEEFLDGVPQNWWCEDTRDKEVILVVKVRGSYTTDTRHHRVCVRQCCSAKTNQNEPTGDSTRQAQGTVLRRSDFQHLSSSYDVVDHLWSSRSP